MAMQTLLFDFARGRAKLETASEDPGPPAAPPSAKRARAPRGGGAAKDEGAVAPATQASVKRPRSSSRPDPGGSPADAVPPPTSKAKTSAPATPPAAPAKPPRAPRKALAAKQPAAVLAAPVAATPPLAKSPPVAPKSFPKGKAAAVLAAPAAAKPPPAKSPPVAPKAVAKGKAAAAAGAALAKAAAVRAPPDATTPVARVPGKPSSAAPPAAQAAKPPAGKPAPSSATSSAAAAPSPGRWSEATPPSATKSISTPPITPVQRRPRAGQNSGEKMSVAAPRCEDEVDTVPCGAPPQDKLDTAPDAAVEVEEVAAGADAGAASEAVAESAAGDEAGAATEDAEAGDGDRAESGESAAVESAGGPALAEAAAAPGRPPCGGKPYVVPPKEAAMIAQALAPSDVDLSVRNKLYSAIARMTARATVDPDVSAKWAAATSQSDKFKFLKTWVDDPSMATWLAQEKHERQYGTKSVETMVWKTKFQVYADHHAYSSPQAMSYCDALLNKAKTRPSSDPRHRKDKNFNEYYVRGEQSTTKKDEVIHTNSYTLDAELSAGSNPDVVQQLVEGVGKGLETKAIPKATPKPKANTKRKANPKKKSRVPKPDASFCALATNQCMAYLAEAGMVVKELQSSQVGHPNFS